MEQKKQASLCMVRMIMIKKSTKQMVRVALLAFVALTICPQVVNAQKQKKFDEAIAKGWVETKGYIYPERVDTEKKQENFKEKAEKMGYVIHYFGVSSVYFYRPDEKLRLEREINAERNRPLFPQLVADNRSDWVDLTADFKSEGKAYILDAYDYDNGMTGKGHKHYLVEVPKAKWTGDIVDGLLEGDGLGYAFFKSVNTYSMPFLFKGTFHKGILIKGQILHNKKDVITVEVTPFQDGIAWMKDNYHGADKWSYMLINEKCQEIINCGISSVKKDFQNGIAEVTFRGVDLKIDKDGVFQGLCEGTTEIPNDFFLSHNLFKNTKVKSLVIPSTVTKIGDKAFSSFNSLETLVIPNSVTSIGRDAFASCKSLKKVVIGNGIHELPNYIFYYCENLESVSLPDNLTTIGEYAFYNCKSLKNISLPETLKEIRKDAFSGPQLQSITFPNALRRIEESAFWGCPFTSVTLPDSLEDIGESVFYQCNSITSATVPSRLIEKIKGKRIFAFCNNLKSVNIVDGLGKITEDSEWYWKNSISPEEKARRDAEIASREENQYDFPLPDYTGKWPDLLDYDLGLKLNHGWNAQKQRVSWHIGGKWYSATIISIESKNFLDFVFNLHEDDDDYSFSPRYGSYRDALAGAYFYWVKSKKRTAGLLKREFW